MLNFGRDAEVGHEEVDERDGRDLLVVQDLALDIHPNKHADLHNLVKGAENESPVRTGSRQSHQLNELFVALVPHHQEELGFAFRLKHVQPLADLLEVGKVKIGRKRNFKLNSLHLEADFLNEASCADGNCEILTKVNKAPAAQPLRILNKEAYFEAIVTKY